MKFLENLKNGVDTTTIYYDIGNELTLQMHVSHYLTGQKSTNQIIFSKNNRDAANKCSKSA